MLLIQHCEILPFSFHTDLFSLTLCTAELRDAVREVQAATLQMEFIVQDVQIFPLCLLFLLRIVSHFRENQILPKVIYNIWVLFRRKEGADAALDPPDCIIW